MVNGLEVLLISVWDDRQSWETHYHIKLVIDLKGAHYLEQLDRYFNDQLHKTNQRRHCCPFKVVWMEIYKVEPLYRRKNPRLHRKMVKHTTYVTNHYKADIIGFEPLIIPKIFDHHPAKHRLQYEYNGDILQDLVISCLPLILFQS